MPGSGPPYTVSKEDLSDPKLYRLNRLISLLWDQISALQDQVAALTKQESGE